MNNVADKIAKLERLAANPGTPAEGVAARTKADELRAKYNLQFKSKREEIEHQLDALDFTAEGSIAFYKACNEMAQAFANAARSFADAMDKDNHPHFGG